MPDLNEQLRSFIDGRAEPVSVHETMVLEPKPARYYPVPVAVLAGAAIVLIPAMVLAGIRWWPGNDEPVGPSAPPPVAAETTTTPGATPEPTTTVAPLPTDVSVPDLNGLTTDEAESILNSIGLELEIVEMYPSSSGFGLVTAQTPLAGELAAPGDAIKVGVRVEALCLTPAPVPEVPEGSIALTVLFECAGDGFYPDVSAPITRIVPSTPDVIDATTRALLAGLTDAEQTMGYSSFFSTESADALNSVTLEGTRLIVDFNESILINNASTSTGSQYFMAELDANLYQFAEIDSIEYRLDGSCEGFYNWLQGSCQISTRVGWEQTVAAWNAERELRAAPGEETAIPDVVGNTFSTVVEEAETSLLLVDGDQATATPFMQIGSWLLDDRSSDPVTWTNWALRVTGSNEEMIWLVDAGERSASGQMTFQVNSVLIIPWVEILPMLRADPFVLDGTEACTRSGSPDPSLVVVAELAVGQDDAFTGAMSPVRAWQIDIGRAAFDEIPVTGIECFVEPR